MIIMDNKIFGQEVMLPRLEYTNKSMQFFVIGGVVEPSTTQLFTKKAMGWPSCIRTSPRPKLEASHSFSKVLEKSGKTSK